LSQVNSLLEQRLSKAKNQPSKAGALAERSVSGNLSGFSGVFAVNDLSTQEKEILETLLRDYAEEGASVTADLKALSSITSEVKAINNQAALLHGERIKKAQEILKKYREGAFTSWLMTTYGNRQTPYNFLHFFEFYEAMPSRLRPQIEQMPRQAIYTLASREGTLAKKHDIVEGYAGETKAELLRLIREKFPLEERDKRKVNVGEMAIRHLEQVEHLLSVKRAKISLKQREKIESLLLALKTRIRRM